MIKLTTKTIILICIYKLVSVVMNSIEPVVNNSLYLSQMMNTPFSIIIVNLYNNLKSTGIFFFCLLIIITYAEDLYKIYKNYKEKKNEN